MRHPPALAERLLIAVLPGGARRDAILGDLHEEYLAGKDGLGSDLWYWRQAAALALRFAPGAVRPGTTQERSARREASMSRWVGDVRYGVRGLLKRPGTSLLLVSTLAVALAANAAVFSVFDALLVRPLSFGHTSRLTRLWETSPGTDVYDRATVAPANFLDWREQTSGTFAELVALEWWEANVRGREVPERVLGYKVSSGYFESLPVPMTLGRGFAKGDDTPGREHQVILGHDLWQRTFAGDGTIVGRSVIVDGIAHTVVGVAGAGFRFPEGAEIWAPLPLTPGAASRDQHSLTVYGLLREGRTVADARAALAVVTSRLRSEHPKTNGSRGAVVVPLSEGAVDPAMRSVVGVWQAGALFVLLIACVNVANLVLARGAERRRELAIRVALGARRKQLVQQLVVEGLLIAAAATALSLPLTTLALRALRGGLPADIARAVPGWAGIAVDVRVVLVTAALAALAAMLFSTLPAIRSSGIALSEALREGGRAGTGGRRRQLGRNVLVTTQIAAALMLLAGAGITAQGAMRMLRGPQGYDPDRLLTFQVTLPEATHKDADGRRTFARRAVERLSSLPGVTSVALANVLPARGDNNSRGVQIEGELPPDAGDPTMADARWVSSRYFETMRIPVLAGRGFDDNDGQDSAPVAIVSRAMAERHWPGRDPIGRRFRAGEPGDAAAPWVTVVGVSGDVIHHWFARRNYPTFYRPYTQEPRLEMGFAVRTEGEPAALARSVRLALRDVDPDQPVHDVGTMREVMAHATIGLQYMAAVMTAFGGIGLLLALSGVYGVMSYRVSLRTLEIGVRIALGATRMDILRTTLSQAAGLTAVGLVIGTAMAFGLARVTSAALQGAVGLDAGQLASFVAALGFAALAAAYIPARRALAVDPARALRDQ